MQCQDMLERLNNVSATIQNFQLILSFIRASSSAFSHSLIIDVLKFLKPLTRALYDQPTVAVALLEQANLLAERFALVEYQIKFSLQMPLILLPTMEVNGEEALKQLRRAVQECAAAHLLVTKFRAKISLQASCESGMMGYDNGEEGRRREESSMQSSSLRQSSMQSSMQSSSLRQSSQSSQSSIMIGLSSSSSLLLSDTPLESIDSLSSKIDRLGVKLNALLSTLEKMFLVYTATHISFHPHMLHSIDPDTIYQHFTGLEKLCTHLLERGDYGRARLLFPSKLQNHLLLHNIIYGLPLLQINSDINSLECEVNGIVEKEQDDERSFQSISNAASIGMTGLKSSSSSRPTTQDGAKSDRTLLLDILNELEQEQDLLNDEASHPHLHPSPSNDNYGTVSKLSSIRTTAEIEREFGVQGSHFMGYRSMFSSIRKQVPSVLLVPDDQGNLDVNLVNRTQLRLTRGVREILVTIIEDVLALAGPPPCHFCIIGLGSHGRMEVAPYSDFEFALVLENEVPDEGDAFARSYFGKFIELMDFMVNCIGEPTGFRLDTQGTPKEFRFRGTPSQIIERTFKNLDAQGIPMAFSLLQPTCIYVGGPPKSINGDRQNSHHNASHSSNTANNSLLSPPKSSYDRNNSGRSGSTETRPISSLAPISSSAPSAASEMDGVRKTSSSAAIPTKRLLQHAKQTSTPNFGSTTPNPHLSSLSNTSPRSQQIGVSISSSALPTERNQDEEMSDEEDSSSSASIASDDDLASSSSSSHRHRRSLGSSLKDQSQSQSQSQAQQATVSRPLRRPSSTVAYDHPGYALYAQYQDQVISRLQHDIWKGQPLHASLARYCLQDHIKMLAPGKKWHKGDDHHPSKPSSIIGSSSIPSSHLHPSSNNTSSSTTTGGGGGGVLGGGGWQGERHSAVHLKDHYLTPLICFTHDIALYYLSHIPTVFPSDVSATAHLMDSLAVSNARTPVPVFSQLFAASFREAWAALNAIRLRAETEYGEQIDAETPVYLDAQNAPPGAVVLTPIERYWLKYVDWVVQKPLFKVLPTFLEAMPSGTFSSEVRSSSGGSSSNTGGHTSSSGGHASSTGGGHSSSTTSANAATSQSSYATSNAAASAGGSSSSSSSRPTRPTSSSSQSSLRRPPRRNSIGQGTHPPGISTTGISSSDILATGEVAVKDTTTMHLLPNLATSHHPTTTALPPLPVINGSTTQSSSSSPPNKGERSGSLDDSALSNKKTSSSSLPSEERKSTGIAASTTGTGGSLSVGAPGSTGSSGSTSGAHVSSSSINTSSTSPHNTLIGSSAPSPSNMESHAAHHQSTTTTTTAITTNSVSTSSSVSSSLPRSSPSSYGHIPTASGTGSASTGASMAPSSTLGPSPSPFKETGLSAHGTISLPEQEVEMMDPALYCVEQLLESVRNGVKVQEWEEVVISLAWTLTLRHSAPKVHLSYYRAFPPEWRHIYYQTLESLEMVHSGLLEHVFDEIRSYADPAGTRLHSKPMDTLWRDQVINEVSEKLDGALLNAIEDKQRSVPVVKIKKTSNNPSSPTTSRSRAGRAESASPALVVAPTPKKSKTSSIATPPAPHLVHTSLTSVTHQWLPSKAGTGNVAVTRADTPEDESNSQGVSSSTSGGAYGVGIGGLPYNHPIEATTTTDSSSSPSNAFSIGRCDSPPINTTRAMPEQFSSLNGKKLDKIQPKKLENVVAETETMTFLFPRNLVGAVSEVAAHTLYRRIVFKGSAHISITRVNLRKAVKDALEAQQPSSSKSSSPRSGNTSNIATSGATSNDSSAHPSISLASSRVSSNQLVSHPSSPSSTTQHAVSSNPNVSSNPPSSPSSPSSVFGGSDGKKKIATAALVVQKVQGITLRQVFRGELDKLESLVGSDSPNAGLAVFGFANLSSPAQVLSSIDHHSFTDSFLAALLMIGTERFPDDIKLVPHLHIDKENQQSGVFRVVTCRHFAAWNEFAQLSHDSSEFLGESISLSSPSSSSSGSGSGSGSGGTKQSASNASSASQGSSNQSSSPTTLPSSPTSSSFASTASSSTSHRSSGEPPLSKLGFDFSSSYRHSFLNVHSGAGSKHLNLVRNILFCLDNMNEVPHPDALYQFLDLDPLSVITSWIKEMKQIQQRWAVRFGSDAKRLFPTFNGASGDLIHLQSDVIARMTHLFSKIQSTLRTNPRRTCLEVLKIVHPILGHVYGKAHLQSPQGPKAPLERFAFISKPVLVSSIYRLLETSSQVFKFDLPKSRLLFTPLSELRSQLQSHVKENALLCDASKVIMDQNAAARWEIFAWPSALLTKLFDSLDWRDLSSPLQLTLLGMLESNGAGRTAEIAIRNCDQLDNALLESLVKSIGGHLTSLHMPGCQKMENRFIGGSDVVKLLADHCPNLRSLDLSGTNIKYFAVQQLTRTAEIKFERLEWLCLDGCKALEKVKLKTPALWHVDARNCPELVKFEAEARDSHWATADLYGSKVVAHHLLMSIGVSLSKPLSSLSVNSRKIIDILEPLEGLMDDPKRTRFEILNKSLPTDYCLVLAAIITYHASISEIFLNFCELDEESVRTLAEACFTNRKAITYSLPTLRKDSKDERPDSPSFAPRLKLSILHTRVNAATQQDVLGRALGTSVYISFHE